MGTSNVISEPRTIVGGSIPDELKQQQQWLVWRYKKRDVKQILLPYDVRTNKSAMTGRWGRSRWCKFDRAMESLVDGRYEGPGYVFGRFERYVGIELSRAIDVQGSIRPLARAIVDWFDSYTEVYRDGRCLRIIIRQRDNLLDYPGARCRTVTILPSEYWADMTGNVLEGCRTTIEDRQWELEKLKEDMDRGVWRAATTSQEVRT